MSQPCVTYDLSLETHWFTYCITLLISSQLDGTLIGSSSITLPILAPSSVKYPELSVWTNAFTIMSELSLSVFASSVNLYPLTPDLWRSSCLVFAVTCKQMQVFSFCVCITCMLPVVIMIANELQQSIGYWPGKPIDYTNTVLHYVICVNYTLSHQLNSLTHASSSSSSWHR